MPLCTGWLRTWCSGALDCRRLVCPRSCASALARTWAQVPWTVLQRLFVLSSPQLRHRLFQQLFSGQSCACVCGCFRAYGCGWFLYRSHGNRSSCSGDHDDHYDRRFSHKHDCNAQPHTSTIATHSGDDHDHCSYAHGPRMSSPRNLHLPSSKPAATAAAAAAEAAAAAALDAGMIEHTVGTCSMLQVVPTDCHDCTMGKFASKLKVITLLQSLQQQL